MVGFASGRNQLSGQEASGRSGFRHVGLAEHGVGKLRGWLIELSWPVDRLGLIDSSNPIGPFANPEVNHDPLPGG
jgi:hypothetical protein